jgi:hypothetical protein
VSITRLYGSLIIIGRGRFFRVSGMINIRNLYKAEKGTTRTTTVAAKCKRVGGREFPEGGSKW